MADDKPKQKQVGKTKSALEGRARKIAKSILAGKPETQALKDAGYSESYATHHKGAILSNPVIQATFTSILEKAGLTDDYIADRVKELSEAKETKYFQKDGRVTDEREVDALGVQADMVQFAAKLKGHLTEKVQSTSDVTVGGSLEDTERAARLLYLLETAEERARRATGGG